MPIKFSEFVYSLPVKFPDKSSDGKKVEIERLSRTVIVGANGAGKTRLGVWLEEINSGHICVLRLAAHRALSIPESASIAVDLHQAYDPIYRAYSIDGRQNWPRRKKERWADNPATHIISDYSDLISLLLTQQIARDSDYVKNVREQTGEAKIVESKLEVVYRIWNMLLPSKPIFFQMGKLYVKKIEGAFHGQEMSDGERIIFYLIGHCITAPEGSLIIIDEPEQHLHRAIVARLYDLIEAECKDKTFIYITHDVDFAASRTGARKFWIKSYDRQNDNKESWELDEVKSSDDFPEALKLELLGSRKNILFCEGTVGGIDHKIYAACYEDFYVKPCGPCNQVINLTKAFSSETQWHNIKVYGIIDRDYRSDEDIGELENDYLKIMKFAEIENLLCSEDVFKAISKIYGYNPDDTYDKFLNEIKNYFDENKVLNNIAHRLRKDFAAFTAGNIFNIDGLISKKNQFADSINSIDVKDLHNKLLDHIKSSINEKNLDKILLLINDKQIVNLASAVFGKHGSWYKDSILESFSGPCSKDVIDCLKKQLPKISG